MPLNFSNAVASCLKKYVTFSGVASRSEYWWFSLFFGIGYVVFRVLNVPSLVSFWSLALLLPSLAVNVRRLHDTGRSGWWYFAWFILPWEVILLCLPTKTSGNVYLTGALPSNTDADVSPSSLTCPSCGKMRLPGQNYCMGCGSKFTGE
ncbi:MAG TPA: DUF805 domain-containing protein [Acidimicrobiales bacterium]|nr:DUF805 domain-containing protein [Acidimicrobiales bacterium]